MKLFSGLLAALLLTAAQSASAVGVGVRAGTNGVGADFGFSVAPTVLARVGYSWLNYSETIDATDVQYDGKLKLSNAALLIDWSPLGPFRITGGLMPNANKLDVTARPTGGSYTLNGNSYPAAAIGSLNGSVKAGNSVAPYLGVGYGNVATAGVNVYFDLGVMYMGSPKAELAASCGAGLPQAQCQALQADVAAEQQRLASELKNAKWYPVASIGITIGF